MSGVHVCYRNGIAVGACESGVRHALHHRWGLARRNGLLGPGVLGDQRRDRSVRSTATGSTPATSKALSRRGASSTARKPGALVVGLEPWPHCRDAAGWDAGLVRRGRRREGRWRRRLPGPVHQAHVPADAGGTLPPGVMPPPPGAVPPPEGVVVPMALDVLPPPESTADPSAAGCGAAASASRGVGIAAPAASVGLGNCGCVSRENALIACHGVAPCSTCPKYLGVRLSDAAALRTDAESNSACGFLVQNPAQCARSPPLD